MACIGLQFNYSRLIGASIDVKLSIDEIDCFFEGQERNLFKYKNSLILKRAVERNLEIIGEAMNRIKQRDPVLTP